MFGLLVYPFILRIAQFFGSYWFRLRATCSPRGRPARSAALARTEAVNYLAFTKESAAEYDAELWMGVLTVLISERGWCILRTRSCFHQQIFRVCA